jgi:hypothetical protein
MRGGAYTLPITYSSSLTEVEYERRCLHASYIIQQLLDAFIRAEEHAPPQPDPQRPLPRGERVGVGGVGGGKREMRVIAC